MHETDDIRPASDVETNADATVPAETPAGAVANAIFGLIALGSLAYAAHRLAKASTESGPLASVAQLPPNAARTGRAFEAMYDAQRRTQQFGQWFHR